MGDSMLTLSNLPDIRLWKETTASKLGRAPQEEVKKESNKVTFK